MSAPVFFFLKTPRAAAFIAELLAMRIKNRKKTLLTGTNVTKIDWTNSKPIVHARARDEADDTCYCFKAKRVLVTTSIGVLDRRGDCEYEPLSTCDPLFEPFLPRRQMKAIRELYIDQTRSPTGMGEYRPVRFQFGEAFWDTKRNFIAIDSSVGRGVFSFFQNLETKKLFPGQNATQTFLTTQAYDEILSQGGLDDDKVNFLLENSLGKAYPEAYFDKYDEPLYHCTEIDPPGRFPDPDLELGPLECRWSTFKGENECWFGAYSSWRVTRGNSRRVDRKFERAYFPLQPKSDPDGEFVVWFSGAAYCDFHSEFVHGAYWSGALAINEMLDDMGLELEKPLVKTEEYMKCFGEE